MFGFIAVLYDQVKFHYSSEICFVLFPPGIELNFQHVGC